MTPVYMPFTYLSESTARMLATLVGPVVVYQPTQTGISESLCALASQGLIEIRTPLGGDEEKLKAALSEFTQWAQMNPGKSTPGPGFLSSRQGAVPFYDDSTINRIRSDIKHHGAQDAKADAHETGFSARLFLAVAEENDRATDHLDHDLKQFDVLEQGFLDSLSGSDEVGFSRHTLGSQIWRDDPGAKLTEQRIRAWAVLAAADGDRPELLITTSKAVVDMLLDTWGESIGLEKMAAIHLSVPPAGKAARLRQVMADLLARQSLAPDDFAPFSALNIDGGDSPVASVTLYAGMHQPPGALIRRMVPATKPPPPDKNGTKKGARHTLIVLVEG